MCQKTMASSSGMSTPRMVTGFVVVRRKYMTGDAHREDLLDGAVDQRRVVDELAGLLGVVEQGVHAVADGVAGRSRCRPRTAA